MDNKFFQDTLSTSSIAVQGWIVYSECSYENRDEIHESTVLLRFLGIMLRFLRLEVSTFVLPFYKMLFMNKLVFFSLVDRFV
jgi:hypothetical protein